MRIKFLKFALILIFLVIPVLAIVSVVTIRFTGPKLFSNATFFVPCEHNAVGLTIDDGPDPISTPRILDVLRDNNVTATFFIVGMRAEQHTELLERITREGHELANHTYTETVTIALNEVELKDSINKTHAVLSEYQKIIWFRPGTAFYNSDIVEEIKSYEYQIVIGDIYPFDNFTSSSQFHSWYIKKLVQPGSIIIMHDARERGIATAETLARVLPQLNSMGYNVSSLGKLQSACTMKP